jgi:putative DNA methylase
MSFRLHRWGYRHYREMFNARQLLGLELSCQAISKHMDERVRVSVAWHPRAASRLQPP